MEEFTKTQKLSSGKAIQIYAKLVFWINVIFASMLCIWFWVMASNSYGGTKATLVLLGIYWLAIGIVLAYIIKAFISAYGEITENSHKTVALLSSMEKMMAEKNGTTSVQEEMKELFTAGEKEKEENKIVEETVAESVEEKTTEEKIYCVKCGAKNSSHAVFCEKCGGKLEK